MFLVSTLGRGVLVAGAKRELPHLTGAFQLSHRIRLYSSVVLSLSSFWLVYGKSAQLGWLLDVASANEPAWSEERSGVAEPERVNSRQLGGVDVVRVVTIRVTRVWRRGGWRTSQNCSFGPGVGGQRGVGE